MRYIKDINDVNIVLREIFEFIDKENSMNKDLKGKRIVNAGDAVNITDYVTLKQVKDMIFKTTGKQV